MKPIQALLISIILFLIVMGIDKACPDTPPLDTVIVPLVGIFSILMMLASVIWAIMTYVHI